MKDLILNYNNMKNFILLLLLIPFYSFGQNIKTDEYFEDGKKVIKKSWEESGYIKTTIEKREGNNVTYRYYISKNGIEVGAYFSVINDYGKYFKVDLSIVNNSEKRIDFLENNISVKVKGDFKDSYKYSQITYSDYISKVQKRQKSNEIITAISVGISNGLSGNTYSQSNSSYYNKNGMGYISTNTTSYSPTLANIQMQQNQKLLTDLEVDQKNKMNFINEGYLKNNTIFPNNTLIGYFLIPYNKKINEINILLNLENIMYVFNNTQ
jgi:hypothetical protein